MILKKISYLLISFMILANIVLAQSITTINIHTNGDAEWIIEKHISFTTSSEIKEWSSFIHNGTHELRYKKDYKEYFNQINKTLKSAENYSKRKMSIQNFNITYDTVDKLPNAFGIIRVKFIWRNFSKIKGDKLFIGDAFPDETIVSPKNVLIIEIPKGYIFQNATPKPDKVGQNRLIWDGTLYYNLKKGEPFFILSPNVTEVKVNEEEENHENGNYVFFVILLFLIIIITLLSWKFIENRIEKKMKVTDSDNDNTASKSEVGKDLNDEEIIINILQKYGGETYQSNIVKESGFSKSKISILLMEMKKKGKIVKIKKGKENLIRLL